MNQPNTPGSHLNGESGKIDGLRYVVDMTGELAAIAVRSGAPEAAVRILEAQAIARYEIKMREG